MNKRFAELEREGWERQFESAEPRLGEAVELYREMGFEVRLEPVIASEADETRDDCRSCRVCFAGIEDRYRIIFTRKKKIPHKPAV